MTTLDRNASTLWIMLLTLASVAMTFLLACATPFTALAAVAATQMRKRDGVLLMLATWIASQAVDLCVRRYPTDPNTIGWGVALGVAAVVGMLAARAAAVRIGGGTLVRIVTAYVVALVAFKAVILLGTLGLSGGAMAFAPRVLARELVRNGAILAGLYTLYHLLVAAGVPAAPRARPATA